MSSRPSRLALLALLASTGTLGQTSAATVLPPVDVPLPEAEKSPSSVSAREPSDLKDRHAEAKDAAEHLAGVPGAIVQDAGGAGQRKTLSLRGASTNGVMVLLDGVPLAGPGEAVDLSLIPAAALDRIDVLRGAGSRYGPGALGGVVNLVSRAPGPTRVFAQASQGSFVTTALSVGGTTRLGPGEGLVLLHGLRSEGTFTYGYDPEPVIQDNPLRWLNRTNNQALQGGGLARYRQTLGTTELDVTAEGGIASRGLAGPVQNPSPDASQQDVRGTLSVHSSTRFDSGGTLAMLGYGRLGSLVLTGGPFGSTSQLESSAGVEAVYTHLLGRHGLTALLTGAGDWLTFGAGPGPSWGRLGVMAGDEVLFFDGRLGVDASVRVDGAGPFWVVSPRAGARVELPWGLGVRTAVGQASRPPSFLELYVRQGTMLPNPQLKPERGLSADVTVSLDRGFVTAQATGFYGLYEDLISYEYYPPSLAKPFNFQAASVAGLELEAGARPWTWLDASAAYTFLSTQNLKDDPRYYLKALPFRPAHRLQVRVVAGVPLLSFRGELLFQSSHFMNRTETLSVPARALLNLAMSSTPFKGVALTVSFEVKNVLDVQSQDVDGYPLPPRAAYLTLAYAWDGAKT